MLSSECYLASGKLSGDPACVNASFAVGDAAPSPPAPPSCALPPAPPTRCFRLAPARLWTCYLAGVILRLGSFPVTLRGGRRCALPPAPPTRFFRLAPVRLWTCYLAGVILRLGWAMDM